MRPLPALGGVQHGHPVGVRPAQVQPETDQCFAPTGTGEQGAGDTTGEGRGTA
jgi:hypothetical protein